MPCTVVRGSISQKQMPMGRPFWAYPLSSPPYASKQVECIRIVRIQPKSYSSPSHEEKKVLLVFISTGNPTCICKRLSGQKRLIKESPKWSKIRNSAWLDETDHLEYQSKLQLNKEGEMVGIFKLEQRHS
ncbi:hypothetical protein C5167_029104 [Papaver somniferum]|nr:hypothetical protein C5167_029104 [Papaver somniferum]